MSEELDELKKLSPEERVRRLRELEELRKKEIEEAQRLLQDSMNELEEDRQQKIIQEAAARDTLADNTQPVNLEDSIGQLNIPIEDQKIIEQEQHSAYVIQMSEAPLGELSNQREYIANQIETGGINDAYRQGKAIGQTYELLESLQAKEAYFSEKADHVGPGYIKQIHAEVNAAASLLDRLKRDYEA